MNNLCLINWSGLSLFETVSDGNQLLYVVSQFILMIHRTVRSRNNAQQANMLKYIYTYKLLYFIIEVDYCLYCESGPGCTHVLRIMHCVHYTFGDFGRNEQ